MAQRLANVDLRTLPRKGWTAYPWQEWTSGDCWRLVSGEDFTCDLEAMRRLVHAHGKRLGVRAITRTDGRDLLIQFLVSDRGEQAVMREGEQVAEAPAARGSRA